jgi:hypothetical protein
MTAPMGCQLIGRWRIIEADLWYQHYLDLCGPATLSIGADGHGEISFGALQAGLDLEYARLAVFFEWEGFDDANETRGSGSADLQEMAVSKSNSPTDTVMRPHSKPSRPNLFSSLLERETEDYKRLIFWDPQEEFLFQMAPTTFNTANTSLMAISSRGQAVSIKGWCRCISRRSTIRKWR